jgi:hypothetical protein
MVEWKWTQNAVITHNSYHINLYIYITATAHMHGPADRVAFFNNNTISSNLKYSYQSHNKGKF